jgi:hypothetical protein
MECPDKLSPIKSIYWVRESSKFIYQLEMPISNFIRRMLRCGKKQILGKGEISDMQN